MSSNNEGRVRGYGLVLVECDQSDIMSLLVMLVFRTNISFEWLKGERPGHFVVTSRDIAGVPYGCAD